MNLLLVHQLNTLGGGVRTSAPPPQKNEEPYFKQKGNVFKKTRLVELT